jgi:spermidine synthase
VRRGEAQRSYFGVYRVMLQGDYNILMHGTTLHGAQKVRDDKGEYVVDTTPATYYHEKSPMAHAVNFVREGLAARNERGRYGVIGLGTGSLGCHAQEGEAWRFFEIDPVIVSIASDDDKFSFLSNCQPNADIVLGDARLTMAREADASFDLIIVDAFSSDAIPMHLMTAEALKLYLAKLTPTGIAVLHVSNRYLDLDGVLGATAPLVPEAKALVVSDDASDGSYASTSSTIVVFSRSEKALEPFRGLSDVQELDAHRLRAWTDDYSDVLGPFLSKLHVNR